MIATRRSPLALAQTRLVAAAIEADGHTVELLEVVTTGDRWSAEGSDQADKGLFVKELEEALLDGRADLAVHSAKDLPGELPAGLAILAVPERGDARDVVVGPEGGLDSLPVGARVATGSPRRRAQLLGARPDLVVVDIRGNIDTRVRKLDEGVADALVLAAAGIDRLGLSVVATTLDPRTFVPAPGQGCLAIEGRQGRPELVEALQALHHADSDRCLRAERAFQAGMGGGCREPIGAYCRMDDEGLVLYAFASASAEVPGIAIAATDGPDDPEGLGEEVAEALRFAMSR